MVQGKTTSVAYHFSSFFFKKKETFFMWHQSISQFPGGSGVKNLPAMQEKRVRSLS